MKTAPMMKRLMALLAIGMLSTATTNIAIATIITMAKVNAVMSMRRKRFLTPLPYGPTGYSA